MSDEFQAPRPVLPVGFNLAEKWESERVESDDGVVDNVAPDMGLHRGNGSDDGVPLLTKDEAITLAKLLVAYPFLSKVL